MAVIATGMWHLTSLFPDASFSFFAWARVWQVIALPFLFIPINTAAYSDLPPDKTGQASALINVARNLGGSIGVSLTTTELAQRAQFHQARLAEHAIPSALNFQEGIKRVAEYFVSQGSPLLSAKAQAVAWIARLAADHGQPQRKRALGWFLGGRTLAFQQSNHAGVFTTKATKHTKKS